ANCLAAIAAHIAAADPADPEQVNRADAIAASIPEGYTRDVARARVAEQRAMAHPADPGTGHEAPRLAPQRIPGMQAEMLAGIAQSIAPHDLTTANDLFQRAVRLAETSGGGPQAVASLAEIARRIAPADQTLALRLFDHTIDVAAQLDENVQGLA